jgi:hypothetical protein
MLSIAFQRNGATVANCYRPGARVGAVVRAGAMRDVNRKLGSHVFESKSDSTSCELTNFTEPPNPGSHRHTGMRTAPGY